MNTPAVMELTGASGRQLIYWVHLGLVDPYQRYRGSGFPLEWSLNDALQAWAIYALSLACTGSTHKIAWPVVNAIEERELGHTICVAWDSGAVCTTAEDVPALVRMFGPLRVLVFPEWALRESVAA